MTHAVEKTDEQWREELSPEEYAVLRQAGTERPFTGPLLEEHRTGIYSCRACGNELFRSDTKFESHCGWPSFYDPSNSDAVETLEDRTLGMLRVEVPASGADRTLATFSRTRRRRQPVIVTA